LASFGIQTASKKGDGTMKMNGNGNGNGAGQVTKKEMEELLARSASNGPTQTIRIEQAPLKITTDQEPYKL